LTEVFRIGANKPETLQRLRRIDTIPGYLGPADFKAFLQKTLEDWTAITNALDLRMDS
jgi:tripartite-type tricarboxylate transporter receptor subunit TctC